MDICCTSLNQKCWHTDQPHMTCMQLLPSQICGLEASEIEVKPFFHNANACAAW